MRCGRRTESLKVSRGPQPKLHPSPAGPASCKQPGNRPCSPLMASSQAVKHGGSRVLEKLLGIELPIIQAPMAGAQDHVLAAAVSNAGGLGSLPCAMLTPDAMRSQLTSLRTLTSKPINVNFFCHTAPAADAARQSQWHAALLPYYKELDISMDKITPGPARAPFNSDYCDVLSEFRPEVVSFHFGLPTPELLARVKGLGCRVLSSATTVEEGIWLEANGVDAVIAQGLEAGGHRGHFLRENLAGQLGTFALVPQLARALRVPVVAAGGVACARSVAAARALGAAGVQVGTAFLLCPEATIGALHHAALRTGSAAAAAHVTEVTNVFTGRPARGIVNRAMLELGPMSAAAPEFPTASADLAPLRAEAERRGCTDFTPLWSGQNASGCREVAAAVLTRELAGI